MSDLSIETIRERLHGYHIEISLYPSGGIIDVTGCGECGTDDRLCQSVSWKTKCGQDIEFAVSSLEKLIKDQP